MPAELHLSTAAKIERTNDGHLITVRQGTRDDRDIERVFAKGGDCQLLHDGRWLSLKIKEVSIVNDLAVWRAD